MSLSHASRCCHPSLRWERRERKIAEEAFSHIDVYANAIVPGTILYCISVILALAFLAAASKGCYGYLFRDLERHEIEALVYIGHTTTHRNSKLERTNAVVFCFNLTCSY